MEKMNKSFFEITQIQGIMNASEMILIRGGRAMLGPDKIKESDIELPDLTYTGPGGVQESDLEIPDITMTIGKGLNRPSRIAARIFGL